MSEVRPRRASLPHRGLLLFFVLLIPATVLAFSKSYFAGVTFSGRPLTTLIQLHTGLMVLWLLLLIVQVVLFRTRRLELHRRLGRSSFVLVPVILVVSLLATHEGLAALEAPLPLEVLQIEAFTWGQLVPFVLCWALAMRHRRDFPRHVRYIVSTAFAVGSAIVLRTLLAFVPGLGQFDTAAAVNWLILTAPLLVFIARDWQRGIRFSPYWVVTISTALMHIGYYTFTKTAAWSSFVHWYAGF